MWRAAPLTDQYHHESHEREGEGLMLELRDLVKHYPSLVGEPVRAVDGVSLTVRAGEMVALYGPSGSGKTTLLLMIATLLAPTSGVLLIGGRDTCTLSEREASRFRLTELGFIRQNFDLLPGVSTIDNAVLKLLGTMRWRQARREIEPLLVRLGLGERLHHRSETLSMGERQRVMIARALSTGPRLLLADEPTGSLDTQRGREVLELLRQLCRERGVAVVLVSHDPMAARYADRVQVLRDGRLGAYEADPAAAAETDRLGEDGAVGPAGGATAIFAGADAAGRAADRPTSVVRP
jgi:putative ABC transport system ATP-binding protein